jgi:hypothetical protein
MSLASVTQVVMLKIKRLGRVEIARCLRGGGAATSTERALTDLRLHLSRRANLHIRFIIRDTAAIGKILASAADHARIECHDGLHVPTRPILL